MRDINEVIREKEAELARINEELSALRITLRLLFNESTEAPTGSRTESEKPAPVRIKSFP